jgi:hypothetical protein
MSVPPPGVNRVPATFVIYEVDPDSVVQREHALQAMARYACTPCAEKHQGAKQPIEAFWEDVKVADAEHRLKAEQKPFVPPEQKYLSDSLVERSMRNLIFADLMKGRKY